MQLAQGNCELHTNHIGEETTWENKAWMEGFVLKWISENEV
jgi:hypothetical protein